MKNTEKDFKVSCTECIYRRRILTCYQKGKDCTSCKNACCCRKCSPDATGQELEYAKRTYFSPGMPMAEYIQRKHVDLQTKEKNDLETMWNADAAKSEASYMSLEATTSDLAVKKAKQTVKKSSQKISKKEEKIESVKVEDCLTTDQNGQLSFTWD